jgi:hypothetical protein
MASIYFVFVIIRITLVIFAAAYYGSGLWGGRWSYLCAPLAPVALLILLEECFAYVQSNNYWSSLFTQPVEKTLPAVVFESDRTFIEVLCAVAAAVLAIGLAETGNAELHLAKYVLTACVVLCFFYLNLQGASVEDDKEEQEKHIVILADKRSVILLVLRNFIYWTFLYGLIATTFRIHG